MRIESQVLPKTATDLNRCFGYACEMAAKQGRNESQGTVSKLLDPIASKLAEDPDLKRWGRERPKAGAKVRRQTGR